MISDKGNKWQYTTDKLYIGAKLVKEVYVGTKKVYPAGANLMRLREIVEDDARYYGDAGGQKYNWYIWCAGDYGEVYDTFGSGDRSLFVRIFCDWHAPKNGQYYDKDKSKPVGFTNWGDTTIRTNPDTGEKYEVPQMRIIWFQAQTKEKPPAYNGDHISIPINPDWEAGYHQSGLHPAGRYETPGDELIWMGWQWWMYQNDSHIYKYDFAKREFGPELTGADIWVPAQ